MYDPDSEVYFRRRLNTRGSEVDDPIYIEPAILSALLQYMETHHDEISYLTAKFIHLFIVESRFLEAFEFDNFIVRNVKLIAAWYDLCHPLHEWCSK